jgi:import receptor subunit TOM22
MELAHSEPFEEETVWERISALDEMVPDSVKSGLSSTWTAFKKVFSATKSTAWFLTSTAAILVLPLSLELERQEYLEQAKRQERDILFGGAAPS